MHFRYLAAALATAAGVSARVLDSTPAPVSPKRDLPLNPPPNDATDPVGIKAVQDFLTATINAATPDAYLFAKTPAQWMADSVAAMVKEYPAYNGKISITLLICLAPYIHTCLRYSPHSLLRTLRLAHNSGTGHGI